MKERLFNKTFVLTLMALPGAIWLLVLRYFPMISIIVAFKDFRIDSRGYFASLFNSKWVGLKNFYFLFSTNDAFVAIRNTVVYNVIWIFLGLFICVSFAIMLNEISGKYLARLYQTSMFFPFFLSWVIAGYFVYAFLGPSMGFLNELMKNIGLQPVDWYSESKYWPFILTLVNIWKGTGYGSVLYLASICNIDKTYYEAAKIDGASKWQQIRNITIPMLTPMMVILTIMAVGRIFSADFGLFYNVPMNSGALYSTTSVIDTYVYRSLMYLGNIGMSTAAGLAQSLVGFVLIMATNWIVKRVNSENALF